MIDWIAGGLEIVAKVVIGRHNRWGWILSMVSGVVWAYIAITWRMYGLLVIVVPAFYVNIRNFYKWSKK